MTPGTRLYKKWFKGQFFAFLPSKGLNRCQYDILRFLAENGPHSKYDLEHGPVAQKVKKRGRPITGKSDTKRRKEDLSLGYESAQILKNVRKPRNHDLVSIEEDTSGSHSKDMLHIEFLGMIVFLVSWKNYSDLEPEVKKIIEGYPRLFPFSEQWKQITDIVGEKPAFAALVDTAKNFQLCRRVEVKIDSLEMKFNTFFHSYIGRMFIREPTTTKLRRKQRRKQLSQWLRKQSEIRNAYISYLAVQDIYDLSKGDLEIDNPHGIRSEEELSFFEDRKIDENRLFPDRLKEFFPKHAPLKYMFTGLLISKLLWKPIKKKPTGFHVSLV